MVDNPKGTRLLHVLINKPHSKRRMIYQTYYTKTLIHYTKNDY